MLDTTMATRAPRRGQNVRSKNDQRYSPPRNIRMVPLGDLLTSSGRLPLHEKQLDLLRSGGTRDVMLHFAGDLSLLDRPCVAIVGSREVSDDGRARARRLARELAEQGVVVASGLALGIDTAAHSAAIAAGGSTVAVIGTPLQRVYPPENAQLQQEIHEHHLLVSPFASSERTFRSSFPKRNRVMAAITDATVIIEASDTSGSLHQAAECARLGRWLFIAKSLADDPRLSWPAKFLKAGTKTAILTATSELVRAVLSERD